MFVIRVQNTYVLLAVDTSRRSKRQSHFFAVSSRSPALRRRDVGSTAVNSGTGATLLEPNCVVISALSPVALRHAVNQDES